MYPECPGKHPLLDLCVISLGLLAGATQKRGHSSSLMRGQYPQGVYLHGNYLLEEYLHGMIGFSSVNTHTANPYMGNPYKERLLTRSDPLNATRGYQWLNKLFERRKHLFRPQLIFSLR